MHSESVTRAIEPRPERSAPALALVPEDLESDVPVAPGDVVGGRYVVDGMLAAGGMGVVCLATHAELGQRVAIKFLRANYAKSDSLVQRFLNEARAAAVLKSEHVVRVIDVGQLDGGRPYLVMEHLEGTDLEALLVREGPFEEIRAIRYALEVTNALEEAHTSGIIHRDIKPENLFLANAATRQIVKVVDFGLAKRIDATPAVVTGPQDSMGSPCYMSPEQITTPHEVDVRTDIWSLGVVLYRLLTMTMPFDGSTVLEVYARVLNAQPRPLRQVRPDLSPGIEAIVDRCLQKDPRRRYQTIAELAAALSAVHASTTAIPSMALAPTPSEPPPPVVHTVPPRRQGPRLLAIAAITLVASFCGAWSVRDADTRAEARALAKGYVENAIDHTSGELRTLLEQVDFVLTPVDLPPDPPVSGLGDRFTPVPALGRGVIASRPVRVHGVDMLAAEREREHSDTAVPLFAPTPGVAPAPAVTSEVYFTAPPGTSPEELARKQEAYRRDLEAEHAAEAAKDAPRAAPSAPQTQAPARSDPYGDLHEPPVRPRPRPSLDDLKAPSP